MPELPEAETVRHHLQESVAGLRITSVRIHYADILLNAGPEEFTSAVADERIRRVARRGKWPLIQLGSSRVVEVQLRMTGRFALDRSPPDPAIYEHLAAEFELEDGRILYYDDRRRLGGFNLWTAGEWEERSESLGPEPLQEAFTDGHLISALRNRRAPVKNLLLDARIVAGVGNLYAAEALHRAELDPRRPGGDLSAEQAASLRTAIREVLRSGLQHGGASFSDFLSPAGEPGHHQDYLAVYGREGESCPRCGQAVRRIKQAGRSTYFCPGCQR